MQVVGQQRLARARMGAGYHPVVRAHALDQPRRRRGFDARHRRGQRRQLPIQRRIVGRAQRLLARIRRQQFVDARQRQRLRQPHAQHLAAPVGAQVPGHHRLPGQRIGRLPALRHRAQDRELGRQRALVAGDAGIDAVGIGLQRGAGLRGAGGEGGLGVAAYADGAQEAIGRERAGPEDLRQPARRDALVHLHLPQPVLRMDEAEAEIGVERIARLDARNRMAIAHDRDAPMQTRQRDGPCHRRLRRLPIPGIAADGRGQYQTRQDHRQPCQPLEPMHRLSLPRPTVRCGVVLLSTCR